VCAGEVMLIGSWNVKGLVHSEFMPTGTTINSGIVWQWLSWKHDFQEFALLQHDSAVLHTSVRITTEVQHLSFTILDRPFHSTIFYCQIFVSFPNWRNSLEDITVLSTIKWWQQVSCNYIIKMHSSSVTDLWNPLNMVKACTLQRWLCGEKTKWRVTVKFKQVTCFSCMCTCFLILRNYHISWPIRHSFFPEKWDLNSTCVLCAEGKYYFQTCKYPYIYYTTSLLWDSEIFFQIMRSGITACERLTFLSGDLP